jgi:hypothetical protein
MQLGSSVIALIDYMSTRMRPKFSKLEGAPAYSDRNALRTKGNVQVGAIGTLMDH